ncbi:hypothetical protein DL96DRAFT_1822666 [Flagelloscypha sp. PMI_526]|nr:hypothetical protein DL96DRAFT_1822666 [Flagelloscypha sp. PMI_526]
MSDDASTPIQNGSAMAATPAIPENYTKEIALEDIPTLKDAMDQFLSNKMVETEVFLRYSDPQKERLYFTLGMGLIHFIKGISSFTPEASFAFADALPLLHRAVHVASHHRKHASIFLFWKSRRSWYASMTPAELHAELCYAEMMALRAAISIAASQDYLNLIREALHLKTAVGIFRSLYSYIQHLDSSHSKQPLPGHANTVPPAPLKYQDPSIDQHMRSGALFGTGLSHLILSVTPDPLVFLAELIGLKGDRRLGMQILLGPGQWTKETDKPGIDAENEGVRRPLADFTLIAFHLLGPLFTFESIDPVVASKVSAHVLERWPTGVFSLLAAGRLAFNSGNPEKAIEHYTKGAELKFGEGDDYKQLTHLCTWELALCNLTLRRLDEAGKWFKLLMENSSWSKAVFTYGYGICLFEQGKGLEAKKLLATVEEKRQKIVGRSIALEKACSRHARRILNTPYRQIEHTLPTLTFGAFWNTVQHTPPQTLEDTVLPSIRKAQTKHDSLDKTVEGWWDDWCILKWLEGYVLRWLALPDVDSAFKSATSPKEGSTGTLVKQAEECFQAVISPSAAAKINLEHWIVYQCHYDLARVYARSGEVGKAQEQLRIVLDDNDPSLPRERKNHYSLRTEIRFRARAALDVVEVGWGLGGIGRL